jgi:hypothetical protein
MLTKYCAYLSVTDSPDGSTVFLHLVEVSLNLLLASIIIPFLGSLGKCLLLGAVPLRGGKFMPKSHHDKSREENMDTRFIN